MRGSRTQTEEFFVNCYLAVGMYSLASAISSLIIIIATKGIPPLNLDSIAEFILQFGPVFLVIVSAYLMWRNSKLGPIVIVAAALFYSWISLTGLQAAEASPDNGALQTAVIFTVILWFFAAFCSLQAMKNRANLDKKNDL
jgi:hypothetical protein